MWVYFIEVSLFDLEQFVFGNSHFFGVKSANCLKLNYVDILSASKEVGSPHLANSVTQVFLPILAKDNFTGS